MLVKSFTDLNATQRDTLLTLYYADQHEICLASGVSLATHIQDLTGGDRTISRQVIYQSLTQLLKTGLVSKRDHPDDGRRTIYEITHTGTLLVEDHLSTLLDLFATDDPPDVCFEHAEDTGQDDDSAPETDSDILGGLSP